MQSRSLWQYAKFVLLVIAVTSGGATTVYATTASSESYQMTESEFGAINNKDSCSGGYCTRASIGNVSGEASVSTNYATKFSPTVDGEPRMEVIIEPGVSDLGELTTDKTSSKTMKIKVQSYLTDGYTIQLVGSAPKIQEHTLSTLTTPTASTPGTEQFGINASVNTTPAIGADPVQVPSSDFSYGIVSDDYKIPDMFKYVSQDVIARSTIESGRTDYTVSMIINISSKTPAGHYDSDFSAIIMPIF